MLKKLFFAAAALFVFSAASRADDYVRLDLNLYCRGGIKCLTEKRPAGIQVTGRRDYANPKHADKCYYSITVNLEKVQEVDLTFEIVDTEGRESAILKPSIEPIRLIDGKRSKDKAVECLELQVNDEKSPFAPCIVTEWKGMLAKPIIVTVGSRITVKAKFKKAN